jgi:hypothetical protein
LAFFDLHEKQDALLSCFFFVLSFSGFVLAAEAVGAFTSTAC